MTIQTKTCPVCDGGLYETDDGRWLHYPTKKNPIKNELIFACEGDCLKSLEHYPHIITSGCFNNEECRVTIEPELGICSKVGDINAFLGEYLVKHAETIKARIEAEKRSREAGASQQKVKAILTSIGAIVEGHFVYSQRDEETKQRFHGNLYVNKDEVLATDNAELDWIIREMADKCAEHDPDIIVGLETGGSKFALLVKQELNSRGGKRVLFASADKDWDSFIMKRGHDERVKGKRAVVVEDILNSGGSARETVAAVREAGGEVIALVALCNRGEVTAEAIFVPNLVSLLDVKMGKWLESECLLCKEDGIWSVSTTLGHGAKFLEEKKAEEFEVPPPPDDDIPF